MHRADRRLRLVEPGTVAAKAGADQPTPLSDEVAVPAGAILLCEQHERPIRRAAGGAARGRQEHQREEAEDLWLVRQERGEETAEANRLAAQVFALERLT